MKLKATEWTKVKSASKQRRTLHMASIVISIGIMLTTVFAIANSDTKTRDAASSTTSTESLPYQNSQAVRGTSASSPTTKSPKLIAGDKKKSLHHFTRARDYIEIKEYARALGEYEQGLAYTPKDQKGWLEKGDCLALMGHANRAVDVFLHAASIDPKSPEAYFKIGTLRMNEYARTSKDPAKKKQSKEHLASANKWFDHAINLDPKHVKSWNNLGVVYTYEEKIDHAIHCFEKAIEIDKHFSDPHKNLGIIYQDYKGESERIIALNHYVKYLDLRSTELKGKTADDPNYKTVKRWVDDLKTK